MHIVRHWSQGCSIQVGVGVLKLTDKIDTF